MFERSQTTHNGRVNCAAIFVHQHNVLASRLRFNEVPQFLRRCLVSHDWRSYAIEDNVDSRAWGE